MIKKVSSQSSSRKSSSRRSSSVVKKSASSEPRYDTTTHMYIVVFFLLFLFSIAVNLLVLYYLNNLEPIYCKCIRDWRHNFIKYFTIFNLTCSFLLLFGINLQKSAGLSGILGIVSLVNLYAFYTYIGDLNDTKCICAVEKQKNLNKFLNIWRYIMVILPIIIIFILIIKIKFM